MEISDNLITSFRDKVNDHHGFVYFQYQNRKDKNHWNIICSCMDWISVAIRGLAKYEEADDIDVRSMQFFSVISSIDIVMEAVTQLSRVFIGPKHIPFKGDNSVFKANDWGLDDNNYFKELRAMFGAHPVNLKRNDEQWFASWPYDHFIDDDSTFQIRLYSNRVGVEDITVGVKSDSLVQFLKLRYGFLEKISDEIDRQYEAYCAQMASEEIFVPENVLSMICVLESESQRRMNNMLYQSVLSDLKRVFSTELAEKHLAKELSDYKNSLVSLVLEVRDNLQSMKFDDLENYSLISPSYDYSTIGYAISKLHQYDFNRRLEPLFDSHMKVLDQFSNNKYGFVGENTADQVFVKLHLMLYTNHHQTALDHVADEGFAHW